MVVWHMNHVNGPPRRHWEHGDDVVARKNKVAFERLRKLAYSDEHKDLGRYGLGLKRTLEAFERFAGMDLQHKRAHLDVYLGRNPDPTTIKTDADWANCVTIEVFQRSEAFQQSRNPRVDERRRPRASSPDAIARLVPSLQIDDADPLHDSATARLQIKKDSALLKLADCDQHFIGQFCTGIRIAFGNDPDDIPY